jgi:hypothetical protein
MRKCQISIFLIIIFAFCFIAYAADNDRDRFVGTWKLVSFEEPSAPGSKPADSPFPSGYIMYDSTGHMAVQITRRQDRPKFVGKRTDQGTPEEIKAAFVGYGAYYGTYEVKEKEKLIIHHLEGALFPNEIGTDNIRYYEFEADKVRLIIPVIVDGKVQPKSRNARQLVWEKVK